MNRVGCSAFLVLAVGAMVVLVVMSSGVCRPVNEEYARQSERILAGLPAYPGTQLRATVTQRNSCETFCWLSRRSYYTLAIYDTTAANVGGATDCAAAETIVSHYAEPAPHGWSASVATYPATWRNGREGCSKIVTLKRRGAVVYVNVNSTETGALGEITISISH